MNQLAAKSELATQIQKEHKWPYFFVLMGLLFPAITLCGFLPSWLDMSAGKYEAHWFTHVHAAVMTSWLLVFAIQPILAVTGNLTLHRRLGSLSIWLGILVIIVMVAVTMHMLIVNHPPAGSFLFDLLLTQIHEVITFTLFFTWGIRARTKDRETHKRMLTLATFVLLIAPVDRMIRHFGFPTFGLNAPDIYFVYQDVLLLLPIIVYDLASLRRIHRSTWIGCVIVIASQLTVISVNGSPIWHKYMHEATAPLMSNVIEVDLSEHQTERLLGDYDSEQGVISISRRNGKLFIQFNGQEKVELGALSETELFFRTEVMKIQFELSSDGKVRTGVLIIVGHKSALTKRLIIR